MPRFRFTLQAVLQHREQLEAVQQRAVAALESQRLLLEAKIRDCQQSITGEQATQRHHLAAGDLPGVRRQAAAAGHIRLHAQRTVLELAGLHRRLETARLELLEAARARKAIELLRERRFEEWKHDQQRRETAALDELAVMRAHRTSAQHEL